MALPKISYPTFDVYLKSLDRKVKFRPFLVKEEKLLLMAKQAEDIETLLNTVKQIINNCVLDESIDVENLPMFDLEMIFIHLRLNSVGETLELTYKCENVVQETPCHASMKFDVDLNEVKFKEIEGHSNKIMLSDNVGVMLKYPSIKIANSIASENEELENILEVIYEHLDYIFDENSRYMADTLEKEEVFEFLGSIGIEQIKLFTNFFNTMPYVETQKQVTCGKCGFEHTILVQGINDFFG